MDCLFCKIVNGDIPADIVYQDDEVLAFRDISPQAPTHILVIPRRHLAGLSSLNDQDGGLAGDLLLTAVLGLVVVVLVNYLSARHYKRWDWTAHGLFTLGMLVLLQVVLGFDNLLYISIESQRAPAQHQRAVRFWGIVIAVTLAVLVALAHGAYMLHDVLPAHSPRRSGWRTHRSPRSPVRARRRRSRCRSRPRSRFPGTPLSGSNGRPGPAGSPA